jgi:hypothetical protein
MMDAEDETRDELFKKVFGKDFDEEDGEQKHPMQIFAEADLAGARAEIDHLRNSVFQFSKRTAELTKKIKAVAEATKKIDEARTKHIGALEQQVRLLRQQNDDLCKKLKAADEKDRRRINGLKKLGGRVNFLTYENAELKEKLKTAPAQAPYEKEESQIAEKVFANTLRENLTRMHQD